MSDLGWLVVGVLGVAAGLSVPLARLSRPHPGAHVHPLRVVPGEGDRRFGSMCLEDELRLDRLREELHHVDEIEVPDGYFVAGWSAGSSCPLPLADPVEGHWAQVAEMLGPVRAEPTVAEVAASRAAHGYIPELDSEHPERLCGPEQPHEKPAGTESAGSGHPVFPLLAEDWATQKKLQDLALPPDAERLVHTWDRLPAVVTVETVTEWGARCRAEIAGWRHEPWAVAL
jgi:hypothetical protein